jgi:hypothetical protein
MTQAALFPALCVSLALALAACGGGGSSPSAPEVTASQAPQSTSEAQAPDAAAQLTVKPLVRVNTSTADFQDVKNVGALAAGGYAVIWDSTTTDPVRDGAKFYLQRYDERGRKVGGETFLYHSPFEQFTQPTVLASGEVLVSYAVVRSDGSSSIYLKRFDFRGAPVRAETEVVARPATADGFTLQLPTITALAQGGYVLSYTEGPPLSGAVTLFIQRFRDNGVPRQDLLRIGGTRPAYRIQADNEGGYFLYTTVFNPSGATGCFGATSEPRTLSVSHYDAQGQARLVIAPGSNNCAEVLKLEHDRFMLLGDVTVAPFSQVLDKSARPSGKPRPIAAPMTSFSRPSLVGKATLAEGTYVLLWRSSQGVEIQHYGPTGTLLGTPLLVPDPGPSLRLVPLVGGGLSLTSSMTGADGNLDVFTQLLVQEGKNSCQDDEKASMEQGRGGPGAQCPR